MHHKRWVSFKIFGTIYFTSFVYRESHEHREIRLRKVHQNFCQANCAWATRLSQLWYSKFYWIIKIYKIIIGFVELSPSLLILRRLTYSCALCVFSSCSSIRCDFHLHPPWSRGMMNSSRIQSVTLLTSSADGCTGRDVWM